MATETELRKPIIKALRKVNAIVVPYVGSTMGIEGVADVFVAHTRWQGWIEFKGPTTKIKPLQLRFIEDMRQRGVNAHIMRLFPDDTFLLDGLRYRWANGIDILDSLIEADQR